MIRKCPKCKAKNQIVLLRKMANIISEKTCVKCGKKFEVKI